MVQVHQASTHSFGDQNGNSALPLLGLSPRLQDFLPILRWKTPFSLQPSLYFDKYWHLFQGECKEIWCSSDFVFVLPFSSINQDILFHIHFCSLIILNTLRLIVFAQPTTCRLIHSRKDALNMLPGLTHRSLREAGNYQALLSLHFLAL